MAPKSGDAGISAMPTEKQPSPLFVHGYKEDEYSTAGFFERKREKSRDHVHIAFIVYYTCSI